MPTRAHDTDVGLDLYCRKNVALRPGRSCAFDTGVRMAIPHGYFGKIESKPTLYMERRIVSLDNLIDESYRGSIVVRLCNLSDELYLFFEGDAIAQLIIMPYFAPELAQVDKLDDTDRGCGGFGSTGR